MVISSNRWLSASEQTINAKYIWEKLKAFGWSEQAIAGVLGNMQVESTINPGIWEGLNPNNTSRGFGMVQYTPGSMVLNRAAEVNVPPGDMDFQLNLLNTDYFKHWIMTSTYSLSYASFKTSTQSPEWLAQAFLRNFERPANQNQPARSTHARRWYDQLRGSGGVKIVNSNGSIDKMIDWMQKKDAAGVTYSMKYRNGPRSYDCSSAVFYALIAGGFRKAGSLIGNTDTLFSLEGSLLKPINRANGLQKGDIFVSGRKGGSGGAAGHTGFALNATQAIHCSSGFNGIGISSNSDSRVRAYSGAPVYWYRLAGTTIEEPTPGLPGQGVIEAPPTDGAIEAPVGDKEITIHSVNDGRECIEQPELIELFGINMETVSFSDVESPNDLLEKGKDYLNNQPLDLQALSVDFAQLYKFDPRYKKLKVGDVITVRNDELNVNARMRIETRSFNLDDDQTGDVELGRQFKTLVNWATDPNLIISLDDRSRRR